MISLMSTKPKIIRAFESLEYALTIAMQSEGNGASTSLFVLNIEYVGSGTMKAFLYLS